MKALWKHSPSGDCLGTVCLLILQKQSWIGTILWKENTLYGMVSLVPTGKQSVHFWSTSIMRSFGDQLKHFASPMAGDSSKDGTIIRGQNEISHPSNGRREVVDKNCNSCTALPSSIKRVFYMSSEGCNLLHEVFPEANHTVLEQLSKVDCIVYAMGSLFTSVCPSLVLRGIGETIASRSIPK
uniref:Uncharacterized protein n=1 Tax=Triticum urartu TaxID=4572 RepID=A0A8R7PPU4_TRIUA